MGVCSCSDLDREKEDSAVTKIPKPVIFHSENFVFLNYTQVAHRFESFERLKESLVDCVVTEIVRYEDFSSPELPGSIIHIKALGENNVQKALLLEVVDGSILIQHGSSHAVDSILLPHKRRLLTQHKPSLVSCNNNLIYLVKSLYEIAQVQRFQSIKAAMRRMRSLPAN